jgi:membrane protease YdiL (CAAX protease family)
MFPILAKIIFLRRECKQDNTMMDSREAFMSKTSPLQQIMMLMMFTFLCYVVFAAISVFLAIALFHVNIFSEPDVMKHAQEPRVLKALQLMQTFQAIGAFIVPAIGFAAVASKKKWAYLRLQCSPKFILSALVVTMVIGAIPFINYMGEWNSKLPFPQWVFDSEQEAEQMMKAFLKFDTTSGLVFNLFMMALLPAVGEELLFRGLLQKLIYKINHNKHVAVWLTAALFSAFHMQFLGFFPRMILGAMFGYLVIESGSLWYSIIGHFTNNAMAVVFTYLINIHAMPDGADSYGSNDIITSLLSAGVMVMCMAIFGKLIMRNQQVD